MVVMTASSKKSDAKEQQMGTKKQAFIKIRPITATLEHPLILDIKLLKKLDMTTFTKKGLIALSKLCGISLVKKSDTKRKFTKTVKSIQYSKKHLHGDCIEFKGHVSEVNKRDMIKAKRKPLKQIPKLKPRINLKVANESDWHEDDSADVVCKKHDKITKTNHQLTKSPGEQKSTKGNTLTERKFTISDVFNGTADNIIPEPCQTCSRSEHPERLHSHPKISMKTSESLKYVKVHAKSTERNSLEEKFKNSLSTKDCDDKESLGKGRGRKSPSAKSSEDSCAGSPQKSISSDEVQTGNSPSEKSPKDRSQSVSPINDTSTTESTFTGNKRKSISHNKPSNSSPSTTKSNKNSHLIKRNTVIQKEMDKVSQSPEHDDLKYVTGCYVCGKQVPLKLRIKHEEECILEWRTRNSLISPDQRKPEPRRPDYRFTASGDVDCEGTFESIWANHKDSLVPCKKCGRTFFPDRIERHETCCNNAPIKVKFKH